MGNPAYLLIAHLILELPACLHRLAAFATRSKGEIHEIVFAHARTACLDRNGRGAAGLAKRAALARLDVIWCDGCGEAAPGHVLASDAYKVLIADLRQGGYVIYLRHAMTATTSEPAVGDFADCSWQRNLSDGGRRQAAAVGSRLSEQKIPVAAIEASPFCRARQTAELAFGRCPRGQCRPVLSHDADGRAARRCRRQAQGSPGRTAAAGRQPRADRPLADHQGGCGGRAVRGRGRHREAERRRHLSHRGATYGSRHHAGALTALQCRGDCAHNGGRLQPGVRAMRQATTLSVSAPTIR